MIYDASTVVGSLVAFEEVQELQTTASVDLESSVYVTANPFLFGFDIEVSLECSVYIEARPQFSVASKSCFFGHARGTDPTTSYFNPCAPVCFKGSVSLGAAQYAILSEDGLSVSNVQTMSPAFVNSVLAANPSLVFLPVNMIAKPSFDPLTQMVSQNGWTISDIDVQPVWVISEQTSQQQADTLVLISTDLQTDLVNWLTLTSGDKDTVLKRLTEVVTLILVRYKDALIV